MTSPLCSEKKYHRPQEDIAIGLNQNTSQPSSYIPLFTIEPIRCEYINLCYPAQHVASCTHMKTEYVVIKIVSARSLLEAIIHRLAMWTLVRLRPPIMFIREPHLIFPPA